VNFNYACLKWNELHIILKDSNEEEGGSLRILVFRISLFWVAVTLLSIKTYIITKFLFDLEIETNMQESILILSSIGTTMILLGISLFFQKNKQIHQTLLLLLYVLISLLLYVNILYYRFFDDFITIPVLFQSKHVVSLWTSFFELFNFLDIFLFTDVLIIYLMMKRNNTYRNFSIGHVSKITVIGIAVILILANFLLAHKERPELISRSFDRKLLVKNLGLYTYHLYDMYLYTNTKRRIVFADNDNLTEVINYVKANKEEPNEDYFGVAKGKNIIMIALESTQSFVINETINDQEITPFLNDLIKQKGTYYFSNFYHQTGQGKTSDAEFILENSLYGLPRGAVFFSNPENQYNSMATILNKEKNYYSAVFHANNKSFWNRDVMYEAIGYNRFFSDEDYQIEKENTVGWGLKDEYFFNQSISYLNELPAPFYAKFLTLTNHFPFSLGKKDEFIPEWESKDGTVNRYFTTVRYQDEALKQFFEQLKTEGLYEDSIFILYGDHYGISENHNKAMGQFLNKEIDPFESIQLQRVPFIVHIPGGKETKNITSVAGQIDVKPTILNLMGVEAKQDLQFGSDLFSKEKREFVVLRDGSFITEKYVMTGSNCYIRETGMELDDEVCKPYVKMAREELNHSDKVIYGDLIRFLNVEK